MSCWLLCLALSAVLSSRPRINKPIRQQPTMPTPSRPSQFQLPIRPLSSWRTKMPHLRPKSKTPMPVFKLNRRKNSDSSRFPHCNRRSISGPAQRQMLMLYTRSYPASCALNEKGSGRLCAGPGLQPLHSRPNRPLKRTQARPSSQRNRLQSKMFITAWSAFIRQELCCYQPLAPS